ncbi:MAG: diadenylate cyclase [Bacilli bacterium]
MDLVFFGSDGAISISGIIDFIVTCIALIGFDCFICYFAKRKFVWISCILISVLYVLATIFSLNSLELVLIAFLIVISILYLIVNMAETRHLLANKFVPQKVIKTDKTTTDVQIYDHEALYRTINEAVLYLAKHKVGAIITFERKDKLKDIIKNGSILNAPVSYELLITIFYPGTRLHDGAVVIRGNTIVAASVYYTPTTKPLVGKYGSRHRAAIGISEICDAVTVVVSEETGRISIAYNGELESYSPDNFYKAFENMMSETKDTATTGPVDINKK